MTEAHVGVERCHPVVLEHAEAGLAQLRQVHAVGGLLRGVDGDAAGAREGGRRPQEVHVVRHVARRVERAVAGDLRGLAVGVDGAPVRFHGVPVAAGADEDVCRHVHEVARARHEIAQAIGARQRALRLLRGLDRVDVEVIGARVPGLERLRLLQQRHDLGRPRLRAAVLLPEVPGMEVHQRLGGERLDVGVLLEALRDRSHRVGIGLVELRALGAGHRRVALRERLDQRAVRGLRLALQPLRLLAGLPGRRDRALFHGRVDMGSLHQGDAPEAHGAARIEPSRLAKRLLGRGVVEAVGQHQSLIEELLCQRRRRPDVAAVRAHPLEQLRRRDSSAAKAGAPVRARLPRQSRAVRTRIADLHRAGRGTSQSTGPCRAASRMVRPSPSEDLVRVLLVNPSYPFEEFPRLLVTLPYVASALRADGHEVEILDLLLARTTPEKIERRMARFRPELVGITSVTLEPPHRELDRRGGAQVRRARADRDGRPARLLRDRGLVPRPARARLHRHRRGRAHHGASWRARSRAAWTCATCAASPRATARPARSCAPPPRPLEDDLDTLPTPARDLVPLARYLAFDSHASVVTSRGCPYECVFCSAPAVDRAARCATARRRCASTRSRSCAAQGFTEITIEDDLFTLYRKHFLAVCGELIRRNTGIRWNAFSRVDTISPEIVETMAKAGCQAICFGVESGNQEVLDLVKKKSNLAQGEGGHAHDPGRGHLARWPRSSSGCPARPRRRCARRSSSRTSCTRSSARSTASTSWRRSRAPRCARRRRSTASRS